MGSNFRDLLGPQGDPPAATLTEGENTSTPPAMDPPGQAGIAEVEAARWWREGEPIPSLDHYCKPDPWSWLGHCSRCQLRSGARV